MKTVIYKAGGTYYVTSEENYKARIQDARKIHRLDFESTESVIEYLCKYCGYKKEDFIIMVSRDLYTGYWSFAPLDEPTTMCVIADTKEEATKKLIKWALEHESMVDDPMDFEIKKN